MTDMRPDAYIEARLAMKSTAEGGRHRAIRSGYRCQCWLGESVKGEHTYHDASVHLVGVDELKPGATTDVRLRPGMPLHWGDVQVGDAIELSEGRRVIGEAVITAIH